MKIRATHLVSRLFFIFEWDTFLKDFMCLLEKNQISYVEDELGVHYPPEIIKQCMFVDAEETK